MRNKMLDSVGLIAGMYRIRNMNFSEAGTLIRNARRRAGLTQAELARGLRMSRSTISQVENGVIAELGVRKLAQLCDRLGLEVAVRPRHAPPSLHEAYARNKEERQAAFRETDAALAKINPERPAHD
jgi:transcriptional regulator with XRE-family HTH domain